MFSYLILVTCFSILSDQTRKPNCHCCYAPSLIAYPILYQVLTIPPFPLTPPALLSPSHHHLFPGQLQQPLTLVFLLPFLEGVREQE